MYSSNETGSWVRPATACPVLGVEPKNQERGSESSGSSPSLGSGLFHFYLPFFAMTRPPFCVAPFNPRVTVNAACELP